MRKINLKSIFTSIFILSIIVFLTWFTAVQHTWKEARRTYNPIISSAYASIIYVFNTKKEKDLLKMSANVIRIQIINIGKDNKNKFSSYSYLCPMLNKRFKKVILNSLDEDEKEYLIYQKEYMDKNVSINFKSERKEFIIGYKKLLYLCKKGA